MKKKGFTLIELLAVIVILAVIAIIATPAVLNIIEDSKKSAAEASARSIVGAAKTHYMQNIMDNKPNSNVDLSTNTLKYDGEQATKGSISYDKDGNAYGKMYISGYCVEIKSDGTVSSDKVKESECDINIPEPIKVYDNGEIVYYNPETNTKCTSSEAVSSVGTKTGCMKWYAFLDSKETTKVNLLLDHNTSIDVAYNTSGTNTDGPVTALAQLKKDISSWYANIKNTAKLIEAEQIAKVVDNTNWNFYVSSGSKTYCFQEINNACSNNTGKYSWLSGTYWTSTKNTGILATAWTVYENGVGLAHVTYDEGIGIRPVITVDKNILK